MRKTDARVRYTKRAVKEAFLSLLREKPINKITVKEVCGLAEINRATFYSHYSDCYALMESIEQELLGAFTQALGLLRGFDSGMLIEAIYRMVEHNENACRVLIFGGASPYILPKMIEAARAPGLALWKKQLPRATDAELEMLYTHLSNGLMHVVVEGFYKYTREEVVSFVERACKGTLELFK
ncbi:MAG: TetR/AcrR family transcriptional regulator [Clostridia bacterium]|nr:TetR/AcrR family transcriptional regulator [Clostridia bacterium]